MEVGQTEEELMSDSYEALVDCDATLHEAKALAPRIIEVLSKEGLIIPEASPDCVFDGEGYPAGPRCADAYTVVDDGDLYGNRFWTLTSSGVEIHAEPWVNVWGFTQFAGASCPRCNRERGQDFLDDVGSLVENYLKSGVVPHIPCPSWKSAHLIHDWQCDPHLGFANLAVVFWNWAPFDDLDWQINIPALLEGQLKRRFACTFGRM